MNTQRFSLWYGVLFIFIVGLDQLTKYSMLMSATTYKITSFLSLHVQLNRGISWGMFHSENDLFFFFITFLICCFIGGFLHHTFMRYQEGLVIFPEVAVIAGACSNLFDRFFHAGVVDFIFFSWRHWSFPLFNVADVAIVLGIFFILLEGLREQ
jgi:signal peptidase II